MEGKTIDFDVDPSETLDHIKQSFADREDIPVDDQRLIYGGKQLQYGLTFEDYGIREGATLHLVTSRRRLIGWRRPTENTPIPLAEAPWPPPDETQHKARHEPPAENPSFDDDRDIVDPDGYYRDLALLSDTVAEFSEFKRCGGRYERADEQTWDQDCASDTDFQDIPDWMWSAFGSLAVGLLPDQFGSVEAVLASLWKTCVVLSRVISSFRELEECGFSEESFNLLLSHPGVHIAEVVKIPIADVEAIQRGVLDCLQCIHGHQDFDITDVQAILWAQVFGPCELLLERLNLALPKEKPPIDDILAVSRMSALLLDLAILSYTGSHGWRFDHDYLQRETRLSKSPGTTRHSAFDAP